MSELHVILGAGPVGLQLAEHLQREGREVRVVNRSPRPHTGGIAIQPADLMDREAARSATAGAKVIVMALGLPYPRWKHDWKPLFENCLDAVRHHQCRFVMVDNLYMYGPTNEPLRENMPLTTYGQKPALRAWMTEAWQSMHARGEIEGVAVRASDFYGPGVTNSALGEIVFGNLLRGKAATVLGVKNQLHSFAYVPDFVAALATLIDAESAFYGGAWHCPHAPAVTLEDAVQQIASLVGTEPKIQIASRFLVSALGLVNPLMREFKEMLYQWEKPFIVDDQRYRDTFGGTATPLADGFAATVEWYRQRSASA